MKPRIFRFIGGPLDGTLRSFHEGSGYIITVNLQTSPGGPPIRGQAKYQFGDKLQADGSYLATYVETVVEESGVMWPSRKEVP